MWRSTVCVWWGWGVYQLFHHAVPVDNHDACKFCILLDQSYLTVLESAESLPAKTTQLSAGDHKFAETWLTLDH